MVSSFTEPRLSRIPINFLPLYKLSAGVAEHIEGIMQCAGLARVVKIIWWLGRWYCWSKEEVGLGLGNLVFKNNSLIRK